MGLIQDFKTIWGNLLNMGEWQDSELRTRVDRYATYADYYAGAHRKQLRVKEGQADDNIALNFVGLVVNRGVAMLLGKGIGFDMEGDANQEYIDAAWDVNHKDILMQKLAQFGGVYGTVFVKILPDALTSTDGKIYPRLLAIDPMLMSVETDPEDIEQVTKYTMRYNVMMNGQMTARRETITPELSADGDPVSWLITNEYANGATGGRWVLMYGPVEWQYSFPPVVHWQNQPMAGQVYGRSDIGDIVELQDRVNFIASNISKIIRYHAHPKTWGRNTAGTSDKQTWGADEMIIFKGDDALIANLEMQSDLASSKEYLMELRQALFDISQTVDLTSMSDKLGSLTNFGLRVLFFDALAKLGAKQELYGEGLMELNYRMQVIGEVASPEYGSVNWPDPLPVNETEQVAADTFELEQKIASKETISKRRGYDWENEQERIQNEAAMGDNVGAAILRTFNAGL